MLALAHSNTCTLKYSLKQFPLFNILPSNVAFCKPEGQMIN